MVARDQQSMDPFPPIAIIVIFPSHLTTWVRLQLDLSAQLLQSPGSIVKQPIGYEVSLLA